MGYETQPRDSRGRWTKRSGALVASTTLAITVAYGPAGVTGVTGVSGGSGVASMQSSLSQVVRTKLAKGKRSAAKGHRNTTWKRLDLERIDEKLDRAGGCALHSYGQVQRFLTRTPCHSLRRMLFLLGDGHGNRIVVSVSWVRMRGTAAARELRGLADVDGTGNITPLSGAIVGAGTIRWTGRYYDSRRSGSLVVIAETEPVRGNPHPGFLDGVADVAAELPRP
ncbi:hypothetical protein AB8O38_08565 [Saccharomonospora xinjiangensis]|uniref:hypothetical protein n=1 Tax=Saccharomonospora xinjiangensis TaxID=75294 RepID=UPI00350FA762